MSDSKLNGIEVPVLEEDTAYERVENINQNLEGIEVPTLEDEHTNYAQANTAKSGGLEDVAVLALEADSYETTEKQKKEMTLENISVPTLEEDNFADKHSQKDIAELEKTSAEVILEEELPKPEHKSQFSNPDLEKIKAEAKKNAVKNALSSSTSDIDKEKSRQMYLHLMAERQAEAAQRGAKIVIVLMIMAVLMSIGFYLFVNLKPFTNASEVGFYDKISNILTYYSIITLIIGILMIFRSEVIKKLASAIYGLTTLLMLYPGIGMLMTKERSDFTVNFILYIVTIALSGVIFFILCTNEPVDMYYKRREDILQ